MSRTSYVVLAVVVLLASAAVVGWSFFGLGSGTTTSISQSTKPATQSSQQKTISTPSKTIASPIDLSNKFLSDTSILYFLRGVLTEAKSVPGGLELVTDMFGEGIPKILVTDATTLVFNKGGVQTPATVNDLKPNQKLGISVIYDLNKKTWSTTKIHIFISNTTNSSQ